jgi:hypothetical protein
MVKLLSTTTQQQQIFNKQAHHSSYNIRQRNREQKYLTGQLHFMVIPDPANPDPTYKQLETAMTHQNEESKMRYKNLILPSINSYPKLTCDTFVRWKNHFEAVCYTTTELYGLLEEGPLQNPIDKPEINDILFQGYNGTVLYFLAQSTYQFVDMYCTKSTIIYGKQSWRQLKMTQKHLPLLHLFRIWIIPVSGQSSALAGWKHKRSESQRC